MRKLLLLLILPVLSYADNSSLNLQLPNGSSNYSSDKFRAGDLDCSNAIGGSTNVEFGVTGIISSDTQTIDPNTKDIGVYARIIVPLDGPRERINCNTLYQLELTKKRLEIQRLEQELNNLRKLQKGFEN